MTTRTNATAVADAAEEAVQPEFNATIPVQAGVGNDARPTVRTTRYPQIGRTGEGKEPNGVDPETGTAADGPVGKPKGPPCPVFRPRRRWRRNQLPDKGYLDSSADSLFTAEEDTVNKRLLKKIKSTNAAQTVSDRTLTPPEGVGSVLQADWESRKWSDLARKVDAGHTRVIAKTDNEPSWLPVAKMKIYDQYFTVQLKTLVSAAVDAITDAAFHITGSYHKEGETYSDVADPVRTVDDTQIVALKSPRNHPKFGKGTTQA